ncbi:MAG: hypothetical protein PHR35_15795 [Kiritimatiellae bacterium]|nr:hypothetical protein [Kiritimatiellia bacterium]
MPNNSETASASGGFSVIEILVAASIVLLIGGVSATILLHAFGLWENGVRRSHRLTSDDELSTQLARDFASAVAGCGFEGDERQCRFRTLAPAGTQTVALLNVEYRAEERAVLRRAVPAWSGQPDNRRFAPCQELCLAYGASDDPEDVWRETWSNPTNAPARLRFRRAGEGGAVWSSLYARRTP